MTDTQHDTVQHGTAEELAASKTRYHDARLSGDNAHYRADHNAYDRAVKIVPRHSRKVGGDSE